MSQPVKAQVFDLLEHQGLSSSSKWEDACNLQPFKDLVSATGERKQLFAEFLNFIRNKERETKRKKIITAKADFEDALSQWINPGNCDKLNFAKAAFEFHSQPFWSLLPEDELDDIFQEYLDDYERKSRHLIQDFQAERIKALSDSLAQDERFNADTPFDKISPLFPDILKIDLLEAWEYFVHSSDKAEAQRRRQLRHRKERKARLAFRAILSSYGERLTEIPWSEFQHEIRDRDCYIELIGSRGSQPYDLFLALGGQPINRSRSRSPSIESLV
jgi:pre-mRNA-processing factor 40